MSYKTKIENYRNSTGLLLTKYTQGCVKITKGEGRLHAITKTDVTLWLLNNDFKVFTEATLKGIRGRVDIFAIDSVGNPYILEIVSSEKEDSLEHKRKMYPKIPIIPIYCKDFDINKFKL